MTKEGLSPKHHGELNIPIEVYPGGENARAIRIAELRTQYSKNPVALQQIDVYAKDTEYDSMISRYVEVTKNNNEKEIKKLEAWFAENYPDIRYP